MKNPEFWVKEAFTITWKEKTVSFQRALQLSLGVTKNIDPLSGMTVNLMDVRKMFERIRNQFSGQNFSNYPDVLKQALVVVKSDLLVGLHLEANDGLWRISANGEIEEMKVHRLLVEHDGEIFEGELSLWKKPNQEIKAEIGQPATFEEFEKIPGAELSIESLNRRWIF